MKCPKCSKNHKKKDGTRCKCGYTFTLDPKQPPRLSDNAVAVTIKTLSASGRYYFTFNQLYVALHKSLVKKTGRQKTIGFVVLVGGSAVLGTLLGVKVGLWAAVPAVAIAAVVAVLVWRYEPKISYDELSAAIRKYKKANPIPNLVEGNRFAGELSREQIQEELFKYAPERILIVPTDDMVDMLVLNRFHFENKTAVVSAFRYPPHVFKACQRFLEKNPELPVEVIHDVSGPGLKLKQKLLADPGWNLSGKDIKDLGIFPDDVKKIKNPVWIPKGTPASAFAKKSTDPVQSKIEQGMAMPLDFAGPTVMMGALALAVVAGLLLMSEELLAEQARRGLIDSGSSGGFG